MMHMMRQMSALLLRGSYLWPHWRVNNLELSREHIGMQLLFYYSLRGYVHTRTHACERTKCPYFHCYWTKSRELSLNMN